MRLVQLDDWSHSTNRTHPDNCGCLQNWTGDELFFGATGWPGFANATGLPLALYLPGAGLCPGAGEANFGISTLKGGGGGGLDDTIFWVPAPADAPKFFRELMRQGLDNGMGNTFEIDFLWFQFLQVPEWRSTLGAFPAYFTALGQQAHAAATAVELCMSFPLHVLSAAALPAITSTRVGEDYDVSADTLCDFVSACHRFCGDTLLTGKCHLHSGRPTATSESRLSCRGRSDSARARTRS